MLPEETYTIISSLENRCLKLQDYLESLNIVLKTIKEGHDKLLNDFNDVLIERDAYKEANKKLEALLNNDSLVSDLSKTNAYLESKVNELLARLALVGVKLASTDADPYEFEDKPMD